MNKKLFKLLGFLLAFVAFISIATFSSATNNSNTKTLPTLSVTVVNPIYEDVLNVQSNKFYSNLPESTSELENATYTDDKSVLSNTIRTEMENRTSNITVYYASQSELDQLAFNSLTNDLFEMSLSETDIPTQGDYLRYNWAKYTSYAKGSLAGTSYNYAITFSITYYTTKEQEDELTSAINTLLDSFQFDENTTDKEKIDTIYEYITSNISYDYDNLNDKDYVLKFTPYAALIHKKAVCQGYAVLFYRLVETCGVDSRVVTGTSSSDTSVGHAWNIVKINDYYYLADSTWDAGITPFQYYLKGSTDFVGHITDSKFETTEFKTKYPIPSTRIKIREYYS